MTLIRDRACILAHRAEHVAQVVLHLLLDARGEIVVGARAESAEEAEDRAFLDGDNAVAEHDRVRAVVAQADAEVGAPLLEGAAECGADQALGEERQPPLRLAPPTKSPRRLS